MQATYRYALKAQAEQVENYLDVCTFIDEPTCTREAHKHAKELSAQHNNVVVRAIVQRIVAGRRPATLDSVNSVNGEQVIGF